MVGRAKGTLCDNFDVHGLVEDLRAFATINDCAFDWELASYAKSRRSQGADRAGLSHYSQLLAVVLAHAPHGHPSLVLLEIARKELQLEYAIMSKELAYIYDGKMDSWTTLCCDKVRLACRHVVDLKRSRTSYVGKELQLLFELIALRESAAPQSPKASNKASPKAAALPPASPPASPSSEAAVCSGFTCQCDDCKPEASVVFCESSCESSCEAAARVNVDFAPADRGGQKRAAEAIDADEEPVPKAIKKRKTTQKASDCTTQKASDCTTASDRRSC